MNIIKFHKLTTLWGITGTFISSFIIFLTQVDRLLRLDLVPEGVEPFLNLVGVLIGAIAVPSIVVSVVLSLYRLAEK